MPNVVALTSEYTPKRLQPIFVSGLFAGMPLGALVASLLSANMLPLWGWRSVFYVGGSLPLVIALLLIKLLPESVRFLAATGADREGRAHHASASRRSSTASSRVPPPGPESTGIPVKYLFTERARGRHHPAVDSVLHEPAAAVFLRQLAARPVDDRRAADFRRCHGRRDLFAGRRDRQPDSRAK